MLVPGIFLIGGTFKSPELNAFPKFELLKTLFSFSCQWAPTSISVKQQFASATPNKFNEWKLFVVEVQSSCVWWAFDTAVFPVSASYAIRHFTNIVGLICNSQPYFRRRDCFIYIGCSTFQMAFPDSRTMPCTIFFPTRKKYPKDASNSPLARYLKQILFLTLPEM